MMLWIKVFLSIAILTYLVQLLDISAIMGLLKEADAVQVVLAILCLAVAQFISALRWTWLARGLGLIVSAARKIQLYFLGMFLSQFLPSIIGGDVARGWLLAKGRENAGWAAAASVILDRVNGATGLLLMICFSLSFLAIPILWFWLWNLVVVLVFLVVITTPKWWPVLSESRLGGRFSGWKELTITSASFNQAWWKSLAFSLIFQALVVQSHVFLGQAVGLELSWFVYGFMVCIIALATALPISFNGFGVREAGYVGIAVWFGGASEPAAAMAALWVMILMLVSLPGGIVLWQMGGTKALKNEN